MKPSLIARLAKKRWVAELHVVMLGIRAAYKVDLGATVAEMAFGEALRLPSGLFNPTAPEHAGTYLAGLREVMASKSFVTPT